MSSQTEDISEALEQVADPLVDEDSIIADGTNENASKNKKKKKKKATGGAASCEVVPAKSTKSLAGGKNLATLRKKLEERKRIEEEQQHREEEERRLIEEEEQRRKDEERRREEAKQRKKEKEKAKIAELRAAGKLLTKKQKEEAQRAKLRHEQLLTSGVKVEGLTKNVTSDENVKKKKPVYGIRKRSSKIAQSKQTVNGALEPSDVATMTEETQSLTVYEKQVTYVESTKNVFVDNVNEGAVISDSESDVLESWEDEYESNVADRVTPSTDAAFSTQVKISQFAEDSRRETAERNVDGKNHQDRSISFITDSRDDLTSTQKMTVQKKAEAAARREKVHEEALAARSKDNLRSPICCILGHVDTGKTKLLDKIRQTNVQEGEAGGITQQIGATFFPVEAIQTKTAVINIDGTQKFKLPGLLVIDTPGHESFTNLRTRGSSLCNIAILVIDIMHGLEPQTLESIELLKHRKCPFVVALNKIDRLYGWEAVPDNGFEQSLAMQNNSVNREFRDRLEKTQLALAERGLNSALYCENRNQAKFVSIVPTSAHTGEGIPDLLMLLVNLTQDRMSDKLMYLSELECTVLEVKVIEGLGTTIDVILSNGVLTEGDRIVVCGLNGPIVTHIRALLTPEPLKELRIKSAYVHHKTVKAALGVKISAHDLDKAIAGSRLLVVGPDDDEEDLKEEIMVDLEGILNRIDRSGKGVCVQASTLGSLEALLEFLKNPDPKNNMPPIPVSGINIGPVYKRDIMRAATMLEKNPELAIMMCFDVKVDKEAEQVANELGVKIFSANIIYHLFDSFVAHQTQMLENKRKELANNLVYPCILKTIAVFNTRNPILLGVDVEEGSLRLNTPICCVKEDSSTKQRNIIFLGRVTGIEQNHKSVEVAKKGGPSVAVKIEGPNQILFGRQVEESDPLYSRVTRASIDVFKEQPWRDEISKDAPMKQLLVHLKKVLGVE